MQKDVAAKLSGFGINISAKTIHNWEKGLAMPNAQQFLALCDILGAYDVLWQFAGIHRGAYAGLNQEGRQKAREFIGLLFQIDAYRDEPGEPTDSPRLLRLYDIPVSAGAGSFLDESGYEMIKVPAYVPATANFALRVSGDSMEPMLQDGQILWVKEQETLNNGDIGIFMYSGDVYCKELVLDGSSFYLRSLNTNYGDIEILDDFGFKTIGKVVS
jgi:SOS-response transcriptional repressor LexA